jgi:hypothetical protein
MRVVAYWKHMVMVDNLYDNSDGGAFRRQAHLAD